MRHQARIRLGDGFQCTCGHEEHFRRVDATPENISAAVKRHHDDAERFEQSKPEKATVSKMIQDMQAFVKHVDEVTMWKPGEPMTMRIEPEPPRELIQRIAVAIRPFHPHDFPTLNEFVRDPGGPKYRDVISELHKLNRIARA